MTREEHTEFCRQFDALMNKLENPSTARDSYRAYQHGMHVEEIALYNQVSVESIERDNKTLEAITQLQTQLRV